MELSGICKEIKDNERTWEVVVSLLNDFWGSAVVEMKCFRGRILCVKFKFGRITGVCKSGRR